MYGNDPLGAAVVAFPASTRAATASRRDLLSHSVDLAHFLVGRSPRWWRQAPRSSPTGRCRRPAVRTTTAARPATRPAPVTNEDYVGASCAFAGGAPGTFEVVAARSSGPRARWPSRCTARTARSSWNLETDERDAGVRRRRRTHDRLHAPSSAATASRTTANFVPGNANGIGFEDLIVIEDYELCSAVAEDAVRTIRGSRDALAYVTVQQAVLAVVRRAGTVGDGPADGRRTREDRPAHHRRGHRPLPDRPAHRSIDGVRGPLFPGVFAIFGHGNVTCLGHGARAGRATSCRRGVARTSRAWRWPRSRTRRPCAAARSWWPRRPSAPARRTWSRRRVWRWPTVCRCCCCPATRSRAAPPTRCCSRSSSSTTRRPRSTTRSVRWSATGIASPAPSSCSTRCHRRWRRCSTRRSCGPAFLGLPQDVQAEAFDFPAGFFEPVVTIDRPSPARSFGARRGGPRVLARRGVR